MLNANSLLDNPPKGFDTSPARVIFRDDPKRGNIELEIDRWVAEFIDFNRLNQFPLGTLK